jgi:hypothetical protein
MAIKHRSKQTAHDLIDAALQTVLIHALQDNPELLKKIFAADDPNIDDNHILQELHSHNTRRHAEIMGGAVPQQSPVAAPKGEEPMRVQVVPPQKKRPFDGANTSARQIFEQGVARLRNK